MAGHRFANQLFPGRNHTSLIEFGLEVILLQQAFYRLANVLNVVGVLRHFSNYLINSSPKMCAKVDFCLVLRINYFETMEIGLTKNAITGIKVLFI